MSSIDELQEPRPDADPAPDVVPGERPRRRRRRRRLVTAGVLLLAATLLVLDLLAARFAGTWDLGQEEASRTVGCRAAFGDSARARSLVERGEELAGEELVLRTFRDGDRCNFALYGDDGASMLLVADINGDPDDPDSVGRIRTDGEGCGEYFLRPVLPDWRLTRACDQHDQCYLFQRDPTDDGARASRGTCDRLLLRSGRRDCQRAYESKKTLPLRGACEGLAATYWVGLRTFGWVAWRDD